jgi:hypothetical protein
MNVRGFARFLILKYGIEPPDTSLGAPIPAEKAARWKEALLDAYNQIRQDLSRSTFYQQIYADLKEEPFRQEFNDLVYSYLIDLTHANLKDAFLYGVKYVDAFNQFRDKMVRGIKDRDRMLRLEEAVYRLQNHIWKAIKYILNLHDIGFSPIPLSAEDQEQIKKLLGSPARGTWAYGPMKNPTKPLLIANPGSFQKTPTKQHKALLQRLEEEMVQEEKTKGK